MVYSDTVADVEAALVRSIAKSLGRDGVSLRAVDGQGSVNRVYIADDLVMRLNLDRSPEAALKEYLKERWCSLVAGEVIRVPSVLDVGMKDGRAYSVAQFLPGPLGTADPDRAWAILGQMLSAVHAIPLPPVDPDLFGEAGTPADNLDNQRELNILSLGTDDPLLHLGVYDTSELPTIRKAFEDLREVKFPFGLCHGDVSPRNLILATNGPPALIDWGCASLEAVPAADFVQIRTRLHLENTPTEQQWQALIKAYGGGANEVLPHLPVLVLLKAFDLVRWAIDRCPSRTEELVAGARILKLVSGLR
jgi:aminoglycoside phosphotransferase (APT) family kinase protein